MSIVNKDTFEQRKKSLNLTNKAISEMAGVTETTIGKIKKDNQNLQANTVTKIAKVLKLTTEQLISPPEASSQKRWFERFGDECLSGASIIYDVPESWIIEHAGLFFTLLAEQSLAQRGEKAQQCLSDFKALDNKIFLRDKDFNPTFASDDHLNAIHAELEAIEKKDLSGPIVADRNQNAHFMNFLCELERTTTSDFQMYDAEEWDKETNEYKEEGVVLEDLSYYLGVTSDAKWKLLPDASDSDQEKARTIIEDNYILSKIPTRLRSKDRIDDLIKWAFQWEENKINELLPEHSNKKQNDRRVFAKAIFKKYFSVVAYKFSEFASRPDALADYIIKEHEELVSKGTHEAFDFEENSNA
ncbi:helix-turn-helix domain-containing protein [Amylibacter sp.]|nr:helix-turn-helix domain-containing protein [bacterium]MDC1531222.1 helix-turn-helix domain-containing protein [Amylibacter sp.]